MKDFRGISEVKNNHMDGYLLSNLIALVCILMTLIIAHNTLNVLYSSQVILEEAFVDMCTDTSKNDTSPIPNIVHRDYLILLLYT